MSNIENCSDDKKELEPSELRLSPMPKTWILDLDGTLVVHDGPFITGKDEFLPGAREFLESIPKRDMIIFLHSSDPHSSLCTVSIWYFQCFLCIFLHDVLVSLYAKVVS